MSDVQLSIENYPEEHTHHKNADHASMLNNSDRTFEIDGP